MLELAAQNRFDAQASEQFRVERGVEAVAGDARIRIDALHALDHREGEARGGVHRQGERDGVRSADQVFREFCFGEVYGSDFVSRAHEPGLGRGEAEGLMAQLIRRDENDAQRLLLLGRLRFAWR